ncbi:MFS transporter [bacterium]|nr:MFS transporter [bacterium]
MPDNHQAEQSSRTQIALLCGSFFFLFMGVAAVQQFLVPVLSARTGIEKTAASSIFALVYFSGPLWLALYAYYFSVLREKWCIVLSGCTYTLFGVLIYFAHDYRLAILAALLWGWGGETLWATGPAQVLNVTDPKRRGSISGLFQSATYSGQMLGVILFGWILAHVGRDILDRPMGGSGSPAAHAPDVMLLVAVGISLIGNVLSLFLRVKPKEAAPPRLGDALMALRRTAGRYLVLLSVANYLGWGLVLTSFTILIVDKHQLDKLSWIILPYYIGRLVVAWLAGHTSDKVGRERVMLAGFVLGAVSLAAVALCTSEWVIGAAALVLGMQAAMVSVAMTAAVGDYIKPEERHLVFAGTNAWGYLTAGTTMILSPLLKDLLGGSFTPSFLLFAVFYGGCAAVAANMRARLRREREDGQPLPAPGG